MDNDNQLLNWLVPWPLPSLWPTMLYPQSSLSKTSTAAASSGECFSVPGWSVKYLALARAVAVAVLLKESWWCWNKGAVQLVETNCWTKYYIWKTKQLMFTTFQRPLNHLNVWTGNNMIASLNVGAHATRILTLAREPHVLLVSLPSCRWARDRSDEWMV